jgi:predicted deacetylase
LHGLYHERRNGKFDDFHMVTRACAEEEIREGSEMPQESSIDASLFIPLAWNLNANSIEIL